MRAVLKGLKKPVRAGAPLLAHTALSATCHAPGAPGGAASVCRRAVAGGAGAKLIVEYQSPDRSTIVRHRVTTKAGRYTDSLALGSAGRWIIVVRWFGSGGYEPTRSLECAASVPKLAPTLTLSCPSAGSLNGRELVHRQPLDRGQAARWSSTSRLRPADEPPRQRRRLQRPARARRARLWQAFAAWAGDAGCRARGLEHLRLHGRPHADDGLGQLHGERGQEDDLVPGAAGRERRGPGRPPADGDLREHRHRLVDAALAADRGGRFVQRQPDGPPGALLLGHWQITVQFAGETTYAPSSASQSLTVSVPFALPSLFEPASARRNRPLASSWLPWARGYRRSCESGEKIPGPSLLPLLSCEGQGIGEEHLEEGNHADRRARGSARDHLGRFSPPTTT